MKAINRVGTASVEQKIDDKIHKQKIAFKTGIHCKNPYVIKHLNNTYDNIRFFSFFYIHKKKELDSRKFSTFGFRWIDMF